MTYSNNFIAKAAASVLTETVPVPKEAIPTNLLVQISSVGPVPPAVAAITHAAAEPPALKYPTDGLARNFLCPSGDNQHFSSTGQLLDHTDAKPPMAPITLALGPLTFVTYTADFKRLKLLECIKKC